MRLGRIVQRQSCHVPLLRCDFTKDSGLDTWNELHLAGPDFVLEKPINIKRTPRINAIDNAKRIERNAVTVQRLRCSENLGKSRLAVIGDAIYVVQLFRAIDAEAHEKPMSLEEHSPGIVQQRPIGLQIIFNALIRLLVFLFEFDDFLKKVQPEQGWLAALPGEDVLLTVVPFEVLPDVGFENF